MSLLHLSKQSLIFLSIISLFLSSKGYTQESEIQFYCGSHGHKKALMVRKQQNEKVIEKVVMYLKSEYFGNSQERERSFCRRLPKLFQELYHQQEFSHLVIVKKPNDNFTIYLASNLSLTCPPTEDFKPVASGQNVNYIRQIFPYLSLQSFTSDEIPTSIASSGIYKAPTNCLSSDEIYYFNLKEYLQKQFNSPLYRLSSILSSRGKT